MVESVEELHDPARLVEVVIGLTGEERERFLYSLSPAERGLLNELIEAHHQASAGGHDDPLEGVGWRQWQTTVLPRFFPSEPADCHREFWEWVYGITLDMPPNPLFAMFGRGLGKSTNAEGAVVNLGARGLRNYFLYCSETQGQANDHVGSLGAMLESRGVGSYYPHLGAPKVGKHGNQSGWRRNRLWTAGGFVVDALGLDKAIAGAKLESQRPDGLVLDDIDGRHDTPATVAKKEKTIAAVILEALTDNAVVIVAQNYTHPNSIAARLEDGRADYLLNRVTIGPIPAVENMRVEPNPGFDAGVPGSVSHRIVEGVASWPAGMPLEECERRITRVGPTTFETESNQKRTDAKGALWNTGLLDETRWDGFAPPLARIEVGVDPNKSGRGDDAGVVTAGIATVEGVLHGFVISDASDLARPEEWRDTVANEYITHRAGAVVVERTGLGEHARLTVQGAPAFRDRPVTVVPVEANMGKADRARPIAQLWRDGRIHLVGYWPYLEQQMTTWVPGKGQSPGAIDAMVHVLTHLMLDESGQILEWSSGREWVSGQETVDGGKREDAVALDWSRRP